MPLGRCRLELCGRCLHDFIILFSVQSIHLIFNRLKLCSQKLHNLGISQIKRFEQIQVAFPHTFQPKFLSAFCNFCIEAYGSSSLNILIPTKKPPTVTGRWRFFFLRTRLVWAMEYGLERVPINQSRTINFPLPTNTPF